MDLAIIGGGAAGIVCALEAHYTAPKMNIIVLERNDRIGKKLLSTGNGRCNYSNVNAGVDNYYGADRSFVKNALESFPVGDTLNFFNKLGIFPREEAGGKIYPYSLQASAMVDALVRELNRYDNIKVETGFYAKSVSLSKKGFRICSEDGKTVMAKRLVIAGGGCASAGLGSDGSAFDLLKSLGHSMLPTAPALVQLKTKAEPIKGLKGIKINAAVRLIHSGRIIASDFGEVLFTDYGVSGPPIFQLSGRAAFKKNVEISLDLMYEYKHQQIFELLEHRREMLEHLTMESFFIGLINKRLGNLIARAAGIEKLSFPVKALSDTQLHSIAELIKDYRIEVTGNNGFKNAQVTAGGIATEDFDADSMESKLIEGLYACGEVLDIYGDCGGFNLQWAWSSGRAAGRAAAKSFLF